MVFNGLCTGYTMIFSRRAVSAISIIGWTVPFDSTTLSCIRFAVELSAGHCPVLPTCSGEAFLFAADRPRASSVVSLAPTIAGRICRDIWSSQTALARRRESPGCPSLQRN
jgi:hypothetical protein